LSAWTLTRRVSAITASCALAGLSVIALTWTQDLRIVAVLVACIGVGFGAWTPIAWGIIQEVAPPGMVGRVMAVYTAVATATSMVGMSFFGWIAESLGSTASVLGIGMVLFVLASGSAWFGRRIRLTPGQGVV